ncbi:MAG: hypothetical protein IKC28_00555 [Clostridia bacterium]|nr:hypothetical protein [Clostridia bacterium]
MIEPDAHDDDPLSQTLNRIIITRKPGGNKAIFRKILSFFGWSELVSTPPFVGMLGLTGGRGGHTTENTIPCVSASNFSPYLAFFLFAIHHFWLWKNSWKTVTNRHLSTGNHWLNKGSMFSTSCGQSLFSQISATKCSTLFY